MKIIVTGSTGQISRPLTQHLVQAGHQVILISSNADKAEEINALGAKAAIGSVEDLSFLETTFNGADAVYTMIPPRLDALSWKIFIDQVADNYVRAIEAGGVKKVVHLSSMGADLAQGGGLLTIYYGVEQKLNALEDVDVTFLRPGTFYTNFFGNIGMIKQAGIIGSNYGNVSLLLAHPRDIATAAFEELGTGPTAKKSVRYVVSDERLTSEIARVLGKAIGKPDLHWVKLADEDLFTGMVQHGISPDVARNLVDMGRAVERGETLAGYLNNKPPFSPTDLESFAVEFAAAYAQV